MFRVILWEVTALLPPLKGSGRAGSADRAPIYGDDPDPGAAGVLVPVAGVVAGVPGVLVPPMPGAAVGNPFPPPAGLHAANARTNRIVTVASKRVFFMVSSPFSFVLPGSYCQVKAT